MGIDILSVARTELKPPYKFLDLDMDAVKAEIAKREAEQA